MLPHTGQEALSPSLWSAILLARTAKVKLTPFGLLNSLAKCQFLCQSRHNSKIGSWACCSIKITCKRPKDGWKKVEHLFPTAGSKCLE